MKASVSGYIYHKAAEDFSDCFDQYDFDLKTNKFSISDGVSKSFFPGIWAKLLVSSFVNSNWKINFESPEFLNNIQKEWLDQVVEIVNKPEQKYYVRNRYNSGAAAAATFVGLSFIQEKKGAYKWEAYALGDSFLFFIPDSAENIDEGFEDKISYLSSKQNFEFDNYPDFFESRNQNHKGEVKKKGGPLKAGMFCLMTDALAEWFIKEKERAREQIISWKNQNDFEIAIDDLRVANQLNNDDSAILIIRLENDGKNEITYDPFSAVSVLDDLIIKKNREEGLIPKPESILDQNVVNK